LYRVTDLHSLWHFGPETSFLILVHLGILVQSRRGGMARCWAWVFWRSNCECVARSSSQKFKERLQLRSFHFEASSSLESFLEKPGRVFATAAGAQLANRLVGDCEQVFRNVITTQGLVQRKVCLGCTGFEIDKLKLLSLSRQRCNVSFSNFRKFLSEFGVLSKPSSATRVSGLVW
jgi:hypothetical protein